MRRSVALFIALLAGTACATTGQVPDRSTVDAAIRARTAAGIRVAGAAPLPPDASIDDGLTSQEAVAIALWNSPSFQATLADLGLARADLADAGLLRNPVFSLLFPTGPKQLEWTLQVPFEALWQRPRRVAAARLNAQAVGERLVWDALTLAMGLDTPVDQLRPVPGTLVDPSTCGTADARAEPLHRAGALPELRAVSTHHA